MLPTSLAASDLYWFHDMQKGDKQKGEALQLKLQVTSLLPQRIRTHTKWLSLADHPSGSLTASVLNRHRTMAFASPTDSKHGVG
jgi:hypothetical protein